MDGIVASPVFVVVARSDPSIKTAQPNESTTMGGSQPEASPAQAALGADRLRANANPLHPTYQHVRDPNVSESQLAAEAEAENRRDVQREQQQRADAQAEKELNAQRNN